MKYHNFSQAAVFLTYLNKVLENDFIRFEIQKLLEGQSVELKKYVDRISKPKITDLEAKEILWGYNKLYFENKSLKNAIKEYNFSIESFEDQIKIKKKVDKHLGKLNLPTL